MRMTLQEQDIPDVDERVVDLIPQVAARLESARVEVRQEAVADLCQLSRIAEASAIHAAVAHLLEHKRWEVRLASLQALGSLVQQGEASAVGCVLSCCGDSFEEVRKAAVTLLGSIPEDVSGTSAMMLRAASAGTEASLAEAISPHLKSRKPQTRAAAVFVLSKISGGANTDDAAVNAISEMIGDSNADVRSSAMDGLKTLANKGSAAALTAIVKRAADSRLEIRDTSAKVLRELQSQGTGGKALTSAMLECLAQEQWEVRFAALFALRKVAGRGSDSAISAALQCLSDDHWQIRLAALDALLQLVKKITPGVTSKLVACIADDQLKVRMKATKALGELSPRGDADVVLALKKHLRDERWVVRSSALKALAVIAARGDAEVISTAAACLEDKQRAVCVDAVRLIWKIAAVGDTTAQRAVQEQLDNASWSVRCFAALALYGMVKSGYGSLLGAFVVNLFAAILSVIVVGSLRESSAEIPYAVQEPSLVWWLLGLIIRFAALWALWKLTVKGFGSLSGATVVALFALSAGGAVAFSLEVSW